MKTLIYIFKASLLYIIFICLPVSCKNNSETKNSETPKETTDSIKTDKKSVSDLENKMLDKLSKLPEWIQANQYIDSLTNHKHGLSVMTEKPNKETTDYCFRVGYNNELRFETYFNFYVNPKTFELKILDVLTDDIVPIDVWRKRELKRNKK